jgi:uncharacterized repeat protein (TIGR01451 family)
MHLAGANANARSFTAEPQPGKVNYLFGSDQSKWQSNLSTFSTVGFDNVYPGVDVSYTGGAGGLEYTFTVNKGANPAEIRLAFDSGVLGLSMDASHNLVLSTMAGQIVEKAPEITQMVNGTPQAVAGGFTVTGQRTAMFSVGAYDRGQALTIDPTIAFSTYLGGTGNDGPAGIAVDSSGNTYVAGSTTSANFPATNGAFSTRIPGHSAGFVTELSPAGNALIYSTYFDAPTTQARGIGTQIDGLAVNSAGNAYITGQTCDPIPTTTGAYKQSDTIVCSSVRNEHPDVFIAELTTAGSGLVYSTLLGRGRAAQIAIDSQGNAYIGGGGVDSTFPTTAGAYQTIPAPSGIGSGFVAELNPGGSALLYSTRLYGIDGDDTSVHAIAVDSSGNAYLAGATDGVGFPTTTGALQPSYTLGCPGCEHSFVAKLNAAGSGLNYATYLDGTGATVLNALAVTPLGEAWVGGSVQSFANQPSVPTTANSFQPSPKGDQSGFEAQSGFLSELNPSGTALEYSTFLGGSGQPAGGTDSVTGVALDDLGNVYVSGNTNSLDFPTKDALQPSDGFLVDSFNPVYDDAISAKFSATGALIYSTYLGGIFGDLGGPIAVDADENVYMAGTTSSTNFPVTVGAFSTTNDPNPFHQVMFVSKLASFGLSNVGPVWGGVGQAVTYSLSVVNDRTGDDAANVLVSDPLPSGLSFDSVVSSQGPGCSVAAEVVSCPLGTIAHGGSAIVSITVTPRSQGTMTNTASVASSLGGDTSAVVTQVGPAGCASTITVSTTVTSDIGPCPGPGVTIGADNITLNLNGHRIFGVGNHSSDSDAISNLAGVMIAAHNGDTVENGEITGFDGGVWLKMSNANTITDLNVHDNVGVDDNNGAVLGDGIVLQHSAGNQLTGNVVDRNGIFDGIGIFGVDSNNNLIQGNDVEGNLQLTADSDGEGIILNAFLEVNNPRRGESISGNSVIDNIVKNNQAAGISDRSSIKGTISGNDVEGNGKVSYERNGIGISNDQNASPMTEMVVEDNVVAGSGGDGIQVGTEGNQIVNNVSVNNGNLPGNFPNFHFDLDDLSVDPNFNPVCYLNLWSGNVWSSAAGFNPSCAGVGQPALAPAFTSAVQTTIPIGVASTFTVAASGIPAPSLSLTAGPLPAWLSFDPATGVLSGTPPAGSLGPLKLGFSAHNILGPDANQSFTLTVGQAATTTSVIANPAAAGFGKAVSFTATVTPTPANLLAPTGNVSFFAYGISTPIATVPIAADGTAQFATDGLAAGSPMVTASYSGDTNFSGSTGSARLSISVDRTVTGLVHGSLTVVAGQTVLVSGAQITGGITVAAGGTLDIEKSIVSGAITAISPGGFRMCGTSMTGSIIVSNASGFVLIGDVGDDACAANTISGSILLSKDHHGAEVIGNMIGGSVTTQSVSGSGAFPEDTSPEISGNHK